MIGDLYPGGARGWIEVICGVMFSGKSEELIRRVRRALIAKKRVQVFKSHLDERYAGIYHVSSHDGRSVEAVPVDTHDRHIYEVRPGGCGGCSDVPGSLDLRLTDLTPRARRGVDDDAGPGHRGGDAVAGADVAPHGACILHDSGVRTAGENAHVMAVGQKKRYEGAPERAGPAGDENLGHHIMMPAP